MAKFICFMSLNLRFGLLTWITFHSKFFSYWRSAHGYLWSLKFPNYSELLMINYNDDLKYFTQMFQRKM